MRPYRNMRNFVSSHLCRVWCFHSYTFFFPSSLPNSASRERAASLNWPKIKSKTRRRCSKNKIAGESLQYEWFFTFISPRYCFLMELIRLARPGESYLQTYTFRRSPVFLFRNDAVFNTNTSLYVFVRMNLCKPVEEKKVGSGTKFCHNSTNKTKEQPATTTCIYFYLLFSQQYQAGRKDERRKKNLA